MMPRSKMIFVMLLFTVLLSSCSQPGDPYKNNSDLIVSVSILPQQYFIEMIGGDHVQVNVMVGPGDSPHSYEPKASQMTALSNSDIYFKIGVEFEDAWMPRISAANPEMLVVDVSENIQNIENTAHEHDDEYVIDPHIWTSPQNGIQIAETIADTLISLDPQHTGEYRSNLDALVQDIQKLQSDIESALSNSTSKSFIVFHPGWSYFAQEFGLHQIPIEIDGSEPSPRELADLIAQAKEQNIHVIFAQPEFSTRTAENIAAEINGKVILISPLAEDWLENLLLLAETFAEVL